MAFLSKLSLSAFADDTEVVPPFRNGSSGGTTSVSSGISLISSDA